MDGIGTSTEDRVLLIGATNRPEDIDEAARRRFVKRLYVPLPDAEAREGLLVHHLKSIEVNTFSASSFASYISP